MRIENKQHPYKKVLVITFITLIIGALAFGSWWYSTHKSSSTPATPQNTKEQKQAAEAQKSTQPATTPSASTGTSSSKGDTSSTANTSLDPSIKPATPDGTFVSNHRPNLSGSPAPNTESSVCHTTPGAQCTIVFTSGASSVSLPTHTVDANGNTSWNWKLSDIGITTGEWTITAKAINGSQVTTTRDPLNLVVKP